MADAAVKADDRWRLPPRFWRPRPTLAPLLFFLAGTWPVALAGLGLVPGWLAAVLLVGLCALAWRVLPKCARRWAWLMAFGALLTGLHLVLPGRGYIRHLPDPVMGAEIRFTVLDAGTPRDPTLHWLASGRGVRVRLDELRLWPESPWQAVSGEVLLRWEGALRHGQRGQASGAFRPPSRSGLPGEFDYGQFLRQEGIRHLFWAAELTVLEQSPTPWQRLVTGSLRAREAVLRHLLAGELADSDRAILAAMTLGFRQGMEAAERQLLIRSGLMHLFSISGLHVGVLFGVLMALLGLSGLGFERRHLVAPVLLLIYVLATGAPPSAMRAWLMLSLWSLGRGLKLPTDGLNSILLAGLLLLVYRPLWLFHPGFQFSFAVVLALVWGWQQGDPVLHWLEERRLWQPRRYWRWQPGVWLAGRVARIMLGMGCAWLGAVGLTALQNQLILPATLLVNAVACPWAGVTLCLAGAKLGASLLGLDALANLVGQWLSWAFDFLYGLAQLSASETWVWPVAQPHWGLALAWYLGLCGLFALARRPRALLVAAVVQGALLLALAAPASRPELWILLPEGELRPVLRWTGPAGQTLICHPGPPGFAVTLGGWLSRQGVGRVEQVLLPPESVNDGSKTVTRLAEHLPVTSVQLLHEPRQTATLRLQRELPPGTRYRQAVPGAMVQQSAWLWRGSPGQWDLELAGPPGYAPLWVTLSLSPPAGARLRVRALSLPTPDSAALATLAGADLADLNYGYAQGHRWYRIPWPTAP